MLYCATHYYRESDAPAELCGVAIGRSPALGANLIAEKKLGRSLVRLVLTIRAAPPKHAIIAASISEIRTYRILK